MASVSSSYARGLRVFQPRETGDVQLWLNSEWRPIHRRQAQFSVDDPDVRESGAMLCV